VRALEEDDLSAESLGRYHASWIEDMGEELQTGALLRKIFMRLGDGDFDTLLSLLRKQPLARILSRYGDIDHPSHLVTPLARMLPNLRVLLSMAALVTDREELVDDVFAPVSSSR
jgi:flavin-dependent dehydrogenase